MPTETEKMKLEIKELKNDVFLLKALLCQNGQKTEEVKPVPEAQKLPHNTEIAHKLTEYGIKPNLSGYGYLKEAVRLTIGETRIINFTHELYPAIAEKFDTTPSRAERSIRHAIEVAWREKGRHDKPTNSEFIASVSEDLRLEENERVQ